MAQVDSWKMPEEYRNPAEPGAATGRTRWRETVAGGSPETGAEDGFPYGTETQGTPRPVTELVPRKGNEGGVSAILAEQLPSLIHDARNMVSVLELYCDLLEEPGVLTAPYRHFAGELRRVGAANRRLLEGLAQLEWPDEIRPLSPRPARASFPLPPAGRSRRQPDWLSFSAAAEPQGAWRGGQRGDGQAGSLPVSPARSDPRQALVAGRAVENLAEELRANRSLLAAMVGHAVTLGMTIRGGARAIAMSGDDLTRVLVNLARNAAEAMPGGGHIQIGLEEGPEFLTLSVADNGPGIPEEALERIFSPGYSTHIGLHLEPDAGAWPVQHRGLGLSIVRSLVAASGGAVWAGNQRVDPARAAQGEIPWSEWPSHGAVFVVEFPLPKTGNATRKSAPGG